MAEPQCESITIEQAIDAAGGSGRYQVFTTALMTLGYSTVGFLYYNIAFLELYPAFECWNGEAWESCEHDDFCENGVAK